MELNKEKIVVVIGSVVLLMGVMTYAFFYGPLIKLLKDQRLVYQNLETTLANSQETINHFSSNASAATLITEAQISGAIDEVTKAGKALGVNIISMKVEPINAVDDREVRMLPISVETESSYEGLGRFFGSVDSLKKSLVTIGNFYISVATENSDKLKTTLTLNMYLLK